MEENTNPYAAPFYNDPVRAKPEETAAERIRRAHIGHEASIQSWGGLCIFAGAGGAIILLFIFLASLRIWTRFGPDVGSLLGALVGGIICLAVMATGWGLRRLDPKSRTPALVLCLLGLFAFPCGTIVNLYVLYLLSSQKGQTIFTEAYAEVRQQTPHIRYGMPTWYWVVLGIFALVIAGAVAWKWIGAGL